jgi:hypothetical protein
MTSPLPLPDWVPWWVHVAILLAILFVGLMYLFMPFSVFGTKSRLESIEARLDEIQGEIRSLALRLPETSLDETDDENRLRARGGYRPPIPPASAYGGRGEASRSIRTEPRLR